MFPGDNELFWMLVRECRTMVVHLQPAGGGMHAFLIGLLSFYGRGYKRGFSIGFRGGYRFCCRAKSMIAGTS